jgi:hypothetical protein
MANLSRTTTRQAWIDRIDRFDTAGQSVAQFCAAQGVSPASFYQWRNRLRSEASTNPSIAGFIPVKLPVKLPSKLPVKLPGKLPGDSSIAQTQPQPATVMSVELPGGVRIRFEVIANQETRS